MSAHRWLTLFAVGALAAACGGSGGGPPSATRLETTFDVTAQEDAAMLDAGMVEDRLVFSDPAAGEYRFQGSADEVRALRVGQPVVISGAGFGIVREVVGDGDETVLRVDEATLGDVIRDGTIEWDYDIAWSDYDISYDELAALPGVTNVTFEYGSNGGSALQNIGYRTQTPRKITVNFTHQGWDFALALDPQDEKLNFKLTASLTFGGSVKVGAIVGEGWVSGFNYSSLIEYEAGAPSQMSTEISGLQGEMELRWAAFRTPQSTLSAIVKFTVPVGVPIPMPGPFGIPFVLQLKMAGRIVPELSVTDASSGGSWKVTYSSDQGFHVEDGGGKPQGSLKSQTIDTSGETVTAGHGPAAFGLGLEFPRFEFGLAGLPPFAFITLDMYSTSLWTPGTTLTADIPPCQYGYTKLSAVAGYALKILGWGGVTDQYTLWEKQENKYLDGKVCTLSGE